MRYSHTMLAWNIFRGLCGMSSQLSPASGRLNAASTISRNETRTLQNLTITDILGPYGNPGNT